MVDYTALGKRIRLLRKKALKTQEDIASSINISVSFFGNIERGTRVPSVDTLVAIADALSVTPDDLLIDSIHPVAKLDKSEVRAVLRYLKEQVDELEINTTRVGT